MRDAEGVPHFVSPLVLPKRRGREAVERLRDYRHAALLPICEALGTGGKIEQFQEQAVGTTLDCCFAELGANPIDYWEKHLDGGVTDLVRAFARLADLTHQLMQHGVLPQLDPERILFCPDRGVLLRAGDVLREGIVDGGVPATGGDLRYCPPEFFLANGDAPRVLHEEQVIYTLAALLYQCLTGGPPYPGRDAAEVADRILSGIGPSTSRWPNTLPPGLWSVLVDALDTEPRRRPASLPVLAATLEAALDGRLHPARNRPAVPVITRRRLLVAGLLLAFVVVATQQFARRDGPRGQLEARLQSVFDLRPLPIQVRDDVQPASAITDIGAQLLRDAHGSRLADWPTDPPLLLYGGWMQLRCGDLQSAKRAFQLALRFRPDFEPARISLGICRLELGETRGTQDLDRALAKPPKTPRDWFFHAAGWFYRGDFATAASAFEKAGGFGDGATSALHRAICALRLGELDVAAQRLAAVERSRPHDPWVLWLHAEVATARGHLRDARAYRERLRLRAPHLSDGAPAPATD